MWSVSTKMAEMDMESWGRENISKLGSQSRDITPQTASWQRDYNEVLLQRATMKRSVQVCAWDFGHTSPARLAGTTWISLPEPTL